MHRHHILVRKAFWFGTTSIEAAFSANRPQSPAYSLRWEVIAWYLR